MNKFVVITFETTSHAVALEKYFIEHKFSGKLIPLPNEISSGCGLAWKTDSQSKIDVLKFLNETNLSWNVVELVNF